MFLEERQAEIEKQLMRDGKVTVHELSKQFGVTEDCIRKDLGTLEKQGLLKRTYGGAVPVREVFGIQEVVKRRNTDVNAKRRLARAALDLIKENDMVFLDISTSNIALAELLVKTDIELTVVTNMIDIVAVLARNPRIRVACTGGLLNKSRDGFWGGPAVDYVRRLKPDIAFVGAVGVDVEGNAVASYDIDDGINKAAIINASKKAYVVAEKRKFGPEGNYNYIELDKLDGIVTDALPSDEVCRKLLELGVKMIVPKVPPRGLV